MKFYRIILARNEIIYCNELIDQLLRDFPFSDENKGQVICALIRAESMEHATRQALEIRDKILETQQQYLYTAS